jgi:hypothetical protein
MPPQLEKLLPADVVQKLKANFKFYSSKRLNLLGNPRGSIPDNAAKTGED